MDRNPVCLIVGAADGLGQALARVFSGAGYVVCVVRRTAHGNDAMVSSSGAQSLRIHARTADACDEQAMRELVREIERDLGPVAVAVFNAATVVRGPVLQTDLETYINVWRSCALGGIVTAKEVLPYMLERGSGSILFSGATASLRGSAGFSAFAAGKAALRTFAQSLARESGPQGIHVAHVVIDGGIDSPRTRASQPERVVSAGPDGLLDADHIAAQYLWLHQQPRDAWSFELDLRPWSERW